MPPKVKPEGVQITGCKVDGCTSRLRGGLGYCSMHYQRFKRAGEDGVTHQPVVTAPDADRFWVKVDRSAGADGCWPWLAKVERTGYGRVWWNGTQESAHRVAYALVNGHIPDGLTIDHRCRNRACQNPRHLRAVTHQVNNRASASPAAINATKTHCKRGHEFAPDNTYVRPDRRNNRDCRRCRAIRDGARHRARSAGK